MGKQPKEVAEQTKKKILAAAREVFARDGFPDAKLREIALKAGASHGLIRHHFGSKDDLWKAVVHEGLKEREEGLKQIIAAEQSTGPVETFKKMIKSHVFFTMNQVELTKILMNSNSRTSPHLDYIIQEQQGILDVVEPVFQQVQEQGYFKGFNRHSLTVYIRALVETPIATSDLANRMLEQDILSDEGVAIHAQRVIDFLFGDQS